MSLDYDKIEAAENSPQTSMSSYSDLFAALAFIFLFLYVISSIQLSLESISSHIEFSKYESQLKQYEVEVQPSGEEGEPAEIDLERVLARLNVLEKQTNEAATQFSQKVETFQQQEKDLIENYQTTFREIKKRNNYLGAALVKEKTEAKRKSAAYETALATHAQQIDKQRKEIEDLRQAADSVAATNDELIALQQSLEKRIKQRDSILDKYNAEKAELAEENTRLRLAQVDLRQELTGKEGRVKELLRDKELIGAEKLKMVATQEKLEGELRASLLKLREKERQRSNAIAEKERFVEAQKALEGQLAQSRERLQKIESANRSALNEKAGLAAVQQGLARKLQQSQLKLKGLVSDRQTSEAEKAQLLAEQKKLRAELAANSDKNEALQAQQDALAADRAGLIAAQKQLEDEFARAGQKLSAMEQARDAADADREGLLAEKQRIAQELADSRARVKEIEEGRAASDAEKDQLAAAQKELEAKLADANQALAGAQKTSQAERAKLLAAKQDLEAKLGDYRDKENLKKNIVDKLKDNFAKNKIDAVINEETGEVVLPFKQAYFDFDSDNLNEAMKDFLKKVIPVYADSIFEQKNIDKHIKSIEVMGFASPIYKGKYVDPRSLSADSQAALNYNMDLSYRRARSIFKYILDKKSMDFRRQDDLMVYLKVAGRSYLETAPADLFDKKEIGMDEFCKTYNCDEFHRAIIRFNLF